MLTACTYVFVVSARWLLYLCGFVDVLVGLRAEVEGLDDPLRRGCIHNGAAHNLGHVPVIICQVHLQ